MHWPHSSSYYRAHHTMPSSVIQHNTMPSSVQEPQARFTSSRAHGKVPELTLECPCRHRSLMLPSTPWTVAAKDSNCYTMSSPVQEPQALLNLFGSSGLRTPSSPHNALIRAVPQVLFRLLDRRGQGSRAHHATPPSMQEPQALFHLFDSHSQGPRANPTMPCKTSGPHVRCRSLRTSSSLRTSALPNLRPQDQASSRVAVRSGPQVHS